MQRETEQGMDGLPMNPELKIARYASMNVIEFVFNYVIMVGRTRRLVYPPAPLWGQQAVEDRGRIQQLCSHVASSL